MAAGVPMQSPGLGDVAEDEELEVWFDWAFVDFWKNNYCECGRSALLRGGVTDRSNLDRHNSACYCHRP